MTPNSDHTVWRLFDTLGNTGAADPARRLAWGGLLERNRLKDACRAACATRSLKQLTGAWDTLASPEVAKLIEEHHNPDCSVASPIDWGRLLRGVKGTLAVALAASQIRAGDFAATEDWVRKAAAAWGKTCAEQSCSELPMRQGSGEPWAILDGHLRTLAASSRGGWHVGAARDCVRTLLRPECRPALRSLALPLMGYRKPTGFLVWLHVDLLEDGFGEFYADPARLGLVPFTGSFVEAVNTAWRLAGLQSTRRHESQRTLAETLGQRDVRWWLEGTNLDTLDGESLGLGLAVALVHLLRDEPLDPCCGVTGAIDMEGSVQPVNHVCAKVQAARRECDTPEGPRITRLVVPEKNLPEARNGAFGSDRVHGVANLDQAIAATSGLLAAARDLLQWQIGAIDRECLDRTGRSLEQQFVDVRVARGLRPSLESEDYDRLEQPARGSRQTERDKLLCDRNDLLRDEETQGRLERPVVPWEQVREGLRRGAVVGDPGFGKTMLLWYEVRERCRAQRTRVDRQEVGPDQVDLAFFVRAAELVEMLNREGARSLQEALLATWARHTEAAERALPWLRQHLEAGHVFLAVDALEEVPIENRARVSATLSEYAECTPKAPLLVSSRLVDYTGCPFSVADENEFELLSFSPEQMKEAVRRWFGDTSQAAELLNHLDSQPAVRAILRSPLLLRLACQSATCSLDDGQPLGLWQRPAELFDDLIKNAVTVWQARTNPTREQRSSFLQFASWVAWWLWQEDPRRTVFTEDRLYTAVAAAARHNSAFASRQSSIQDLCDAGIITSLGPDQPGMSYLFTHRTVQEYLAARALAEQEDGVQVAMEHVYDPDWQPVLQYLGAALDDSKLKDYICKLLRRNRKDLLCRPFHLAVLAAMNAPPDSAVCPPSLLEDLVRRAVDVHLGIPDWMESGGPLDDRLDVLIACGNQAVRALAEALFRHDDVEVQRRAVRALVQLEVREAVPDLIRSLLHRDRLVRRIAVTGLARLRARDAVPDLIHTLYNIEDDAVAFEAAWALGVLQAREAVPNLIRALHYDDYYEERGKGYEIFRGTVAIVLAALHRQEPLPELIEALHHEDENVQRAVRRALEVPTDLEGYYDRNWYCHHRANIGPRALSPESQEPIIGEMFEDWNYELLRTLP